MECNREEAFRARESAIKKMENGDFTGAQKIALKAQILFPELQNISQVLNICNVHCAADRRVNGEMDWYAILQVEPTTDQIDIKKQYRRLAFSLHPDKNSFYGAEAAFKLVAEANRELSDETARFHYDIKRQSALRKVPKQPTQQHTSRCDVPGYAATIWTICPHCWRRYLYHRHLLNTQVCCVSCKNNYFAYNLNEQYVPTSSSVSSSFQAPAKMFPSQQGHPVKPSSARGTTDVKPRMTVPQCDEYTKWYSRPSMEEKANHSGTNGKNQFSAMKQDKPFVPTVNQHMGRSIPVSFDPDTFDRPKSGTEDVSAAPNATNVPSPVNLSSTGTNTYMDVRINVAQCDINGNGCTDSDKQANQSGITSGDVEIPTTNKSESSAQTFNMNTGGRWMPDRADLNVDRKNLGKEDISTVSNIAVSSSLQRSARRKNNADGSSRLDSISKKKQRINDLQSIDLNCKQLSDHTDTNAVRQSVSSHVYSTIDTQEKANATYMGDQDNVKAKATDTVGQNQASCSVNLSFPDADFFNFEKLRDVKIFAVGQIWAVYDNLDGMPRFYARIKSFDASNFKVHITWLEYAEANEAEEKWTNEELPVACGSFRLGTTEVSQDRLMFSHIVFWSKGKRRNYEIHPRKGEVWAVYKGWSMQWGSDADNHRSYEYDVVEVLSNFSVMALLLSHWSGLKALSVYLGQLRKNLRLVASSELLLFSHSVPFCRTDGNEKVGIPAGFLKLDTAGLPMDLEEAFPSVTLDFSMSPGKKDGSTSIGLSNDSAGSRRKDEVISSEKIKSLKKTAQDSNCLHDSSPQNRPFPSIYSYPDTEFHNFEECRSFENFACGQIWALYNDHDSFPNFYGWISEVELEPFKVHLTWLEACPQLEQGNSGWSRIYLSAVVNLKLRTGKPCMKQMLLSLICTRNIESSWQIEILPKVGEIWAIYMNWTPDWTPSSIDACEFAISEIIERTEASTKISF